LNLLLHGLVAVDAGADSDAGGDARGTNVVDDLVATFDRMKD